MSDRAQEVHFHSPLGEWMAAFIREKRACGYRYESETHCLRRLDRFLCEHGLVSVELPRALVERWMAKRPHERPRTHGSRISIARQLACYLGMQGLPAYVPPTGMVPVCHLDFTPYIFTREQVQGILEAVDRLKPNGQAPLRHVIMPEVFHLLYGCGMRVGEVLGLTVEDVDLVAGILTVRQGKFRKDRLVPVAPAMAERLRAYAALLAVEAPTAPFFPGPYGRHCQHGAVYGLFRQLLWQCGIPHGGRGKGPRLHDLRHTFAVHRLEAWYRQGEDLGAKLPILAAYMGHESLAGTQRYLRLTPAIFPDIAARMDSTVGHIIPRRRTP